MKSKHIILIALLALSPVLFAQFGIKTGVNMANEIKSFSQADIAAAFDSRNLNGYQIGFIYQTMPKKSGLGMEFGALLTQKGSVFTDTISGNIKKGYRELNFVEVPVNLRYRLSMGIIGIYGIAGIYGSYELSGKTVNEDVEPNVTTPSSYASFMDHVDYGYNLGLGIELFNKLQLGGTWSQGIKTSPTAINGLPTPVTSSNRVFSINLVYLF